MNLLKSYGFALFLFTAILFGGLMGFFWPIYAIKLKWISDIFLNLILTAVTPLVFFSVTVATQRIASTQSAGKMVKSLLASFLFLSCCAAIFMLLVLKLTHPSVEAVLTSFTTTPHLTITDQFVKMVSVADFTNLLSHQNLLPLIVFSILLGISLRHSTHHRLVMNMFDAGNEAMNMMIKLLMYFAPIGFFAFFATLIAELGPKIVNSYFNLILIYYIGGAFYLLIMLSLLVLIFGKSVSLRQFWRQMPIPIFTSLATCSSAAAIPVSMEATKKMGIADFVYESAIPLSTFILKQGTVLGAVIKIYFLLNLFHLSFSDPVTLFKAVIVSLLAGPMMGAVPGGGMLGELLIITIYQFPIETLPLIAAIGIMIDPLATVINVVGNNVCTLLIANRLKSWGGFYLANEANTNSISPPVT